MNTDTQKQMHPLAAATLKPVTRSKELRGYHPQIHGPLPSVPKTTANTRDLRRLLQRLSQSPDGPQIIERAKQIERTHRRAMVKHGWRDEDSERVAIEALEQAEREVRMPEAAPVLPEYWEPFRRYTQYVPPREVREATNA